MYLLLKFNVDQTQVSRYLSNLKRILEKVQEKAK